MARAFVEGLGWVEKQTKAVNITENGTYKITPDRGMVLNSVMVTTDVGSDVDLSEYVKKTDYATRESAGVVKSDDRYGTRMVNGILDICAANKNVIDNRTPVENPLYGVSANARHTIVAANIDYAVKSVLSDAKVEMTAEEQAAALAWLGLADLVARIEALENKANAKVITFTIDWYGSTYDYTALEGMTWEEWCNNSTYNTDMFRVTENNEITNGAIYLKYDDVSFVLSSDTIQANTCYIVG